MSLTIVRIPAAAANQPARPIRRTPVGAVDHHMGGYLLGTDGMFQKPSTGYSTNYGIGLGADGKVRVSEYVAPDLVAWGNGNTDMNTRAVSIEHANDRAKYPDLSAKPTAEVHEASALLHAQLAVRFDWRIAGKLQLVYAELSDYPKIGPHFYDRAIPGFGRDFNVIPHRAVAKKTCPEHLDVRWIVDRANHIIREGFDDTPTNPTATEGDDVSFADQIKHKTVDAPAVVVLADTLLGVQQSATKLDELLRLAGQSDWTKHRDVDAPNDVIDADTLTAAQNANSRLDALEPLVRAIADKLGV
ncbi:N-acetylmuramoyl-L-alanine amidase [Rathayibacter sp. PhB127]|uniref:peptidoglycan recognition protein family protein n=1 Tax=Rathayibacter sp. PhB127 TaxID=2485176 RepID=UPI000F4C981C|nr:N-acetylmuramoyl-L-alanine amidase [Rathayibacter sp. PhB127]ROS28927.1 N-acetylmuramoyl-L-alanine amidase [Rathayibacter sp. PhB127]